MSLRLTLLIVCIVQVLSSCSSIPLRPGGGGTAISITQIKKQKHPELLQSRSVFIGCMEASNDTSASLAELKLTESFRESKIGGTPMFDVYTPNSRSGCLASAKSQQVGILLTGSVFGEGYSKDSSIEESRNKSRPGTAIKKTIITQSANITVNIKAYDVETGSFIFEESKEGYSNHRYEKGKGSESSRESLWQNAVRSATKQIAEEILPETDRVRVRFKSDCLNMGGPDTEIDCQQAISYLSSSPSRIDKACDKFAGFDASNTDILYNQGLCAEYDGADGVACELYNKADALISSPDRLLDSALARLRCI